MGVPGAFIGSKQMRSMAARMQYQGGLTRWDAPVHRTNIWELLRDREPPALVRSLLSPTVWLETCNREKLSTCLLSRREQFERPPRFKYTV